MVSTAAASLCRVSSPSPGDPGIAHDFVTLSLGGSQLEISAATARTEQQTQRPFSI